jgi:hypothetical protein
VLCVVCDHMYVLLPFQLASMAHASGTAVGGGLECNLSNWLGRFHQINKMRCRKDEQAARTPSSTPGRTPKAPHASEGATRAPSILSDFTNYS